MYGLRSRLVSVCILTTGLLLPGTVLAAEENPITRVIQPANTLFILLGAVMILAMHGGFAFLEVGSVRKKNQVNALNKIICEWSFSTVIYFLIGYPIARGVSFLVPIGEMAHDNGFEYVRFFLLLGFAACIPAIISGGVAERMKFWPNSIAGGIFVGLVYPLIEGSTWGSFCGALGGQNRQHRRRQSLYFAHGGMYPDSHQRDRKPGYRLKLAAGLILRETAASPAPAIAGEVACTAGSGVGQTRYPGFAPRFRPVISVFPPWRKVAR